MSTPKHISIGEHVYTILVATENRTYHVDEITGTLEDAQNYALENAEYLEGPLFPGRWVKYKQPVVYHYKIARDPDLHIYVFPGTLSVFDNPALGIDNKALKKAAHDYVYGSEAESALAWVQLDRLLHNYANERRPWRSAHARGVSAHYIKGSYKDVVAEAILRTLQMLKKYGTDAPLNFFKRAYREALGKFIVRSLPADEALLHDYAADRDVAYEDAVDATVDVPAYERAVYLSTLEIGKNATARKYILPSQTVTSIAHAVGSHIKKKRIGKVTPPVKVRRYKQHCVADSIFVAMEGALYATNGDILQAAKRMRLIPYQIVSALYERGLTTNDYKARRKSLFRRAVEGEDERYILHTRIGDYIAKVDVVTKQMLEDALLLYGSTQRAGVALGWSKDSLLKLPFYYEVRAKVPMGLPEIALKEALQRAHGDSKLAALMLCVKQSSVWARIRKLGYYMSDFTDQETAATVKRTETLLATQGNIVHASRILKMQPGALTQWLTSLGLSHENFSEQPRIPLKREDLE